MAQISFTGSRYSGADGANPLNLNQPGDYEVSDAKAAQLTQDFPHEFTHVVAEEKKRAPSETTPPEAPNTDETTGKAPEPIPAPKPAKKGS